MFRFHLTLTIYLSIYANRGESITLRTEIPPRAFIGKLTKESISSVCVLLCMVSSISYAYIFRYEYSHTVWRACASTIRCSDANKESCKMKKKKQNASWKSWRNSFKFIGIWALNEFSAWKTCNYKDEQRQTSWETKVYAESTAPSLNCEYVYYVHTVVKRYKSQRERDGDVKNVCRKSGCQSRNGNRVHTFLAFCIWAIANVCVCFFHLLSLSLSCFGGKNDSQI